MEKKKLTKEEKKRLKEGKKQAARRAKEAAKAAKINEKLARKEAKRAAKEAKKRGIKPEEENDEQPVTAETTGEEKVAAKNPRSTKPKPMKRRTMRRRMPTRKSSSRARRITTFRSARTVSGRSSPQKALARSSCSTRNPRLSLSPRKKPKIRTAISPFTRKTAKYASSVTTNNRL